MKTHANFTLLMQEGITFEDIAKAIESQGYRVDISQPVGAGTGLLMEVRTTQAQDEGTEEAAPDMRCSGCPGPEGGCCR